ncbi:hypothetical protein M2323_004667 [Rhodoblastus acidophilus]|uniref:hypothetical protein n=1 Tax=Rhodoblastus acidophilus TaxID=1074 RepID=UPI002224CE53|nr:hypothetical protein [Rhodoblastus acidophilus]MCW2286855.1 hypothetical protein [Rhodoblastus acidophilus]MCW2335711.1 hypothetical protein [Rhodoblastus acidophilus]
MTIANPILTAAGTCLDIKSSGLGCIDFFVDDSGGGSTITFESSSDDATWTALTTGVYTLSNGNLVSLGGSTTTSTGRYIIDASVANFVRARVSTYVSGSVVTRYDESAWPLNRIINMLATGLVAQGTTQGSALPIQATYNVFATVATSSGAVLPSGVSRNGEVVVKNGGANALAVYPPVGNSINNGSTNASVSVAAGAATRFISDGTGSFYTF